MEPTNLTPSQKAKAARNVTIAHDKANGETIPAIANKHDISERQVNRILSNKQCTDILDHITRVKIAHAKGITKKELALCYSNNETVALKAIQSIKGDIGISPTRTPTQYIMNIYGDNNNVSGLSDFMREYMGKPEAVDAEFRELIDE